MKPQEAPEKAQPMAVTVLRRALPALFSMALITGGPLSFADDDNPFAEAKLFFQLNNTDEDLGIHAIIDGEPWKRLKIYDPGERKMLDIRSRGRLRKQGLTELRFESAEPNFEDLSPGEFFNRFPPGEYEIEGVTLDGRELESTVEITHVMPAPPENFEVSGSAVPGGLLNSGDAVKFQVLATDEGGNETSSESCFVVQ